MGGAEAHTLQVSFWSIKYYSLKPIPLYSGSGSPMHAVAAFITLVYFYVAL